MDYKLTKTTVAQATPTVEQWSINSSNGRPFSVLGNFLVGAPDVPTVAISVMINDQRFQHGDRLLWPDGTVVFQKQ